MQNRKTSFSVFYILHCMYENGQHGPPIFRFGPRPPRSCRPLVTPLCFLLNHPSQILQAYEQLHQLNSTRSDNNRNESPRSFLCFEDAGSWSKSPLFKYRQMSEANDPNRPTCQSGTNHHLHHWTEEVHIVKFGDVRSQMKAWGGFS